MPAACAAGCSCDARSDQPAADTESRTRPLPAAHAPLSAAWPSMPTRTPPPSPHETPFTPPSTPVSRAAARSPRLRASGVDLHAGGPSALGKAEHTGRLRHALEPSAVARVVEHEVGDAVDVHVGDADLQAGRPIHRAAVVFE